MDDSNFNPVVEFRAKWGCIFEERLECPVCLEIPTTVINQCVNGHNICQFCRNQLKLCPVCQAPFSATSRNYLMEEIIEKFEDMKVSLMELEKDTNTRINSALEPVDCQITEDPPPEILTTSIETQTDEPESLEVEEPEKPEFVSVGTQTDNEERPVRRSSRIKEKKEKMLTKT